MYGLASCSEAVFHKWLRRLPDEWDLALHSATPSPKRNRLLECLSPPAIFRPGRNCSSPTVVSQVSTTRNRTYFSTICSARRGLACVLTPTCACGTFAGSTSASSFHTSTASAEKPVARCAERSCPGRPSPGAGGRPGWLHRCWPWPGSPAPWLVPAFLLRPSQEKGLFFCRCWP